MPIDAGILLDQIDEAMTFEDLAERLRAAAPEDREAIWESAKGSVVLADAAEE